MKDINSLLNQLHTLKGKQAASSPEACVDPAEAGTKTDVDQNATPTATEIQETTGTTTGTDGPAASEVADAGKVEEGDVSAPSAESFTVEGAAAKSAASGFAAKAADLRAKLASFAQPAASAPAASAPAASAPADKQASEPQVGYFHRRVTVELMKSATGRGLIEEALTENLGMEAARKLIKSAAAEFEGFELNLLNEKIAAYEHDLLQKEAAEQRQAQADHLQGLLKEASSDEERQKILLSSVMLKQAASRFENHPEASQAFALAVAAAEKVANDMAGGMPPEEAAGGMAAGGEPTIEELLSALAELVQSGQISEEEAQQIVMMLEQSMSGGGDPAAQGMDPGMDPNAMPPPGMEEMPKAAYAQLVAQSEDMLAKVAGVLAQN